MAGSRFKPYFFANLVIGLDQIDQSGLEDWSYRIPYNIFAAGLRSVFRTPMLPFGLTYQIAGVIEGWHPFSVNPHSVPADMVHMQMGAEHEIDRLRLHAERLQIVQPGRVAVVLGRR